MISHNRAQALISARFDAPLDPAAQRELLAHLATCPRCRAFAQQTETMARDLRALPLLPASPTVTRAVLERVNAGRAPWARFGDLFAARPVPAAALALVALLLVGGLAVARFTDLVDFVDPNEPARLLMAPTTPDEATPTPTLAPPTATLAEEPTAEPTLPNINVTPTPTDPAAPPTPTATSAPASTESLTATPTDTPADTPAPSPTATPAPTSTAAPTATPEPTPTDRPEPTATLTPEPSATSAPPTETPEPTPTDTPTEPTPTETLEPTPTDTPMPPPTETPPPPTSTLAPSPTPAPTETPAPTPTNTSVPTPTQIPSPSPTSTPTETPAPTATDTPTPTPTLTPTSTPTQPPPPTATPPTSPAIVPINGASVEGETAASPVPAEGAETGISGVASGEDAATEDADGQDGADGDGTQINVDGQPVDRDERDDSSGTGRDGDDDDAGEDDGDEDRSGSGVRGGDDGFDEDDDNSGPGDGDGDGDGQDDEEDGDAAPRIVPIGSAATEAANAQATEAPAVVEPLTPTAAATSASRLVPSEVGDDLSAAQRVDAVAESAGRLVLSGGEPTLVNAVGGASLRSDAGELRRIVVAEGQVVALCPATEQCRSLSAETDGVPADDVPLGWAEGRALYIRQSGDTVTYLAVDPDGGNTTALLSGGPELAVSGPVIDLGDRLLVPADEVWLELSGFDADDAGPNPYGDIGLVRTDLPDDLIGFVADGRLVIAPSDAPGDPSAQIRFSGVDYDVAPSGDRLAISTGETIVLVSFAGKEIGRFANPEGIEVGSVLWTEDGIYFVDRSNDLIWLVDPDDIG